MKAFILALTLIPAAAAAEGLTHRERGEIAVAQCADRCMAAYLSGVNPYIQASGRLNNLMVSAAYRRLDEGERDALIRNERTALCLMSRRALRRMDQCDQTCTATADAYGCGDAYAESRFKWLFDRNLALLQSSGLWIDHESPALLTPEFDEACESYFGQLGEIAPVIFAED